MKAFRIAIAATLPFAAVCAEKWLEKSYNSWTPAQAEQVLAASPWAHQAGAVIVVAQEDPATKDIPLPRPANVPDPGPSYKSDGYGVDDGNWDGGVPSHARRGDPPTLPVLIRWQSARPVRGALLKMHDPALVDTEATLATEDKDYVIAVMGLVAGHKAPDPNAETESDQHASGAAPYDVNSIRQVVNSSAALRRAGKAEIRPEDVRVDESTGLVQIYFPRTDAITLDDKTVVFHVTYGKLRVVQPFRLKDMVLNGRLEL